MALDELGLQPLVQLRLQLEREMEISWCSYPFSRFSYFLNFRLFDKKKSNTGSNLILILLSPS